MGHKEESHKKNCFRDIVMTQVTRAALLPFLHNKEGLSKAKRSLVYGVMEATTLNLRQETKTRRD